MFYRNPGVDILLCPECKVRSIVVAGDLRESGYFSEEVRFHATGVAPITKGHPDEPATPKRHPPRPFVRTPAQDTEMAELRAELATLKTQHPLVVAEVERLREVMRTWSPPSAPPTPTWDDRAYAFLVRVGPTAIPVLLFVAALVVVIGVAVGR